MKKDKMKICIVGGGNISNTRHIPALKKLRNVEIVGVLSDNQKSIDRTIKKHKIKNFLLINDPKNDVKKVQKCAWFSEVDAVVIGAPPLQHYPLVHLCLELEKHVLVEKPMMMNEIEAKELIEFAKKKKKIFCVMHNFQYADDMMKLNKIIEEKKYGDILSITEVQFTNRNRRLPKWYNELPLGLFYDEAAHFVYLLEKHAGKIKIENAHAVYNKNKEATPLLLNVTAQAGNVPVQMLLNMNSPVCQWYYIVNFEKNLLFYDFFKDILVNLPTDNEHLGKDVLKNDFIFTFQYWRKFIRNGIKMFSGNLLYGHDAVIKSYVNSIIQNKVDKNISADQGLKNVITLNEIIERVNKQ